MSAVDGFKTSLTNNMQQDRGGKKTDDNLPDDIIARRDSEELACVILSRIAQESC